MFFISYMDTNKAIILREIFYNARRNILKLNIVLQSLICFKYCKKIETVNINYFIRMAEFSYNSWRNSHAKTILKILIQDLVISWLINNLYVFHRFPILTGSTNQHVGQNIRRRKGRYCEYVRWCLFVIHISSLLELNPHKQHL